MTTEELKITNAITVLECCRPYSSSGCGASDEEIDEAMLMGAEALERAQWIPVSEKLPKENGWYQCTVILNDLPLVMELFYKNDKWLDNRRINMFDTYDIYGYGNTKEKHKLSYQELISEFEWTENVISWKTLPEPYKAEREVEE